MIGLIKILAIKVYEYEILYAYLEKKKVSDKFKRTRDRDPEVPLPRNSWTLRRRRKTYWEPVRAGLRSLCGRNRSVMAKTPKSQ